MLGVGDPLHDDVHSPLIRKNNPTAMLWWRTIEPVGRLPLLKKAEEIGVPLIGIGKAVEQNHKG
jgi:hypothetical protein